VRRSWLLGVFILTVNVAGVTVAWAKPSGQTKAELSRASLQSEAARIDLVKGGEAQVVKLIIEPGGTSGWHRHPVQGMFLVDKGTMTNYGLGGPPCDPVDLAPGKAILFGPHDHAHLVRNAGQERLEFTVLYFNLASGQAGAEPADRPAECPADLN
jgi:quercetin dioxygenase-like cupin family protein